MAASGNGRTNQEAFECRITGKYGVETSGWPPVVLLICGLKVRFLPGSPLFRNDLEGSSPRTVRHLGSGKRRRTGTVGSPSSPSTSRGSGSRAWMGSKSSFGLSREVYFDRLDRGSKAAGAFPRTYLACGPSRPYNPATLPSLPARASASTRSPRPSAKAAWARCIGRRIRR
jgi:hypothetical protein